MRVLVTGANGFVGGHVVERLLADGHAVIAIDRVPRGAGREEAIAAPTPASGHDLVRLTLDLADAPQVRVALAETRPEAAIHLAWYADPRDYLTAPANLGSLNMTTAFAETLFASGCRKLVVGGTCIEYAPREQPLVETDPVAPSTLYAACKHAAWLVVRALAQSYGAELAWARIFHMHGPREHERRLIPWVARELRRGAAVDLTDGRQVRDHLHVSDVATGLIGLTTPGTAGIFNVCSGEPVTLRHVLEVVGEIVGRPDLLRFGARPHRPGEVMFLAGDSGRLRSLGWAPKFGLRDGLIDALRSPA